ncbi:MAG: CaiB/BaiF CoA-transferase family protein [Pseudomonadota bacterium]
MSEQRQGPLVGLKVVELAGIGPAPLGCTLLADMGASVLRVDRNVPSGLGSARGGPKTDLLRRGRQSVSVDLKQPEGIETVLKLVEEADALIDPFRPGVTERLGLGPDDCLARNPRLLYARMTGWGQAGPLSHAAGHDLNYLSLTGITHSIGPKELPTPPLNVVADMGGGAMFLAFGLLAGVYEAQRSGHGQVVDVSMLEGSAFLALGIFGARAAGHWKDERQANMLDGGAPFYRCYETSDQKFVSVAAIETKFYAILLDKLGLATANDLPEQMDRDRWPELAARFEALFREKTRDEWCAIMEGTDICFAPVLSLGEAFDHPHNQSRDSFVSIEGVMQPGPAPRFSRTPGKVSRPPPEYGADTEQGLAEWGFSADDIARLSDAGVVGWKA